MSGWRVSRQTNMNVGTGSYTRDRDVAGDSSRLKGESGRREIGFKSNSCRGSITVLLNQDHVSFRCLKTTREWSKLRPHRSYAS